MKIEEKRCNFQSYQNLSKYKSQILIETNNHIIDNDELIVYWNSIVVSPESFQSPEINFNEIKHNLYRMIINSFLRVSNSGYRKYLRDKIYNREKQHAHQINILTDPSATNPEVPRTSSTTTNNQPNPRDITASSSSSSSPTSPMDIDLSPEPSMDTDPSLVPSAPSGHTPSSKEIIFNKPRRRIILPARFCGGATDNELKEYE